MNLRNRKVVLTFLVAVGMLVFMAGTAVAWSTNTHVHMGEAVAEEGGASQDTVNKMAELSQWADEPGQNHMVYPSVYENGEPDTESGTFGYNAEYNPWYGDMLGTLAGSVSDKAGSSLNVDHWLSYSNYDGIGWPDGEGHRNAGEFVTNAKDLIDEGDTAQGLQVLGRGQHYMQDMSVTYHTVAWDNFGGIWGKITDGEALHHFQYEGYIGDEMGGYNLDEWSWYRNAIEDGAAASWEYELDGQDDVEEFAADMAQYTLNGESDFSVANDYPSWLDKPKNEIMPTDGGDWESWRGQYATEQVLEESAARTAAVYAYAAPGVFDYNGEVVEPSGGGDCPWYNPFC